MVAVFLLFVVVAMAALAIDLVSFYTARSEAQLAADSAALAGARVMANSGATSGDPTDLTLQANAQNLASAVASQIAVQNKVGGRNLNSGEVLVDFPPTAGGKLNPKVRVTVSRSDLPTFFARILGRTQVTVSATAAAEAYNPSGLGAAIFSASPPVATNCLKPWLLANNNPHTGIGTIFNPSTGTIQDFQLLGYSRPFSFACSDDSCTSFQLLNLANFNYIPASQTTLPAPPAAQTRPSCSAGFNAYQLSIAGCVRTPIACGSASVIPSTINIDLAPYPATNGTRARDEADAINCLAHSAAGKGDSINAAAVVPPPPFQFIAGADNPIPNAAGKDILVSDSLVTVPVFDSNVWPPPPGVTSVQVIGFLQLFLSPNGTATAAGNINAEVINMVGCGSPGPTTTLQSVLGSDGSPVPVRLVKPQ